MMRILLASLFIVVALGGAFYIPNLEVETTGSLSAAFAPDAECGWGPRMKGDHIHMEFDKCWNLDEFEFEGNGNCGTCHGMRKFKCETSIDDETWEDCADVEMDLGCGHKHRIKCSHKRHANFGRCHCNDETGGTGHFKFCGDEWYSNTLPCMAPPKERRLPKGMDSVNCPTMPAGGYPSGFHCMGTCKRNWHAAPEGPKMICADGKWISGPGCIGDWPKYPDEDCDEPYNLQGKSVFTPYFVDGYPKIEDADHHGFKAQHRDNLHMKFYMPGSYAVKGVLGIGPLVRKQVIIDDNADIDTWRYFLGFTQPDANCLGIITLIIPIGELDSWGFAMSHDLKYFYLDGQFFINSSRKVEVSGRIDDQLVDADFPIRIILNREFIVDLSCELKIYGTPHADAVITLFRESAYPDKTLTVWYLVSHQYPFMAKVPINFDGLHENGDIKYWPDLVAVTPHRCISDHCCVDDISPTEPHFCFQLIKVVYYHTGLCESGAVTYTGKNSISWEVSCRNNPAPYPDPAWCQLNPLYKTATGMFSMASNDICRVELNYNPLLNVKAYLYAYQSMPLPRAKPDCCGFVAANDAWFMIDLKEASDKHMELAITKMELVNLTVGTETDPLPVTVYSLPTGWLPDPPVEHMFPSAGGYQVVYCNKDATNACKKHDYPVLYWKMYLDEYYFGLFQADLPKKLYMEAGVRVWYDWLGKTHVMEVMTSGVTTAGQLFVSNTVPVTDLATIGGGGGAVTSSGGAMVGAGIGVACLGLAAAGVAVFIYHRRHAASASQKLQESTA